jgi:hypothetical protein
MPCRGALALLSHSTARANVSATDIGGYMSSDDLSGEVAVHLDGDVLLVTGHEEVVAAYLARLFEHAGGQAATPGDHSVAAAAGGLLASAVGLAGTHGQYVRFAPGSMDLLRQHAPVPAGDGFFHMFVKDGGRFAGNMQWQPAQLVGEQALALQSMGTTAALMVAIRDVQEAVERVEDKVEDVLVLAQAQQMGDVLGRYRFLEERVAAAARDGSLSQTDWDAVAAAGADVAVTVDRLRAFLLLSLQNLPLDAPADDRARKLERLVDNGKFAEALGLLVVAEQSLFLWHRLRLLQIQRREPEHLANAIADARLVLEKADERDGQLVSQMYEVLASFGQIRPLELHRFFSRKKLKEDVATVQRALEEFAAARNAQVSSWPELKDPTLKDAVDALHGGARAVGGRAKELGIEAVSSTGRVFESLGQRLQRREQAAALDEDAADE